MNYQAYLIVVCNQQTNAIEDVCIWSSPEWEQSRCLPDKYTYVVYAVHGESFSEAKSEMIRIVRDVVLCNRLHRLWPMLKKNVSPDQGDG